MLSSSSVWRGRLLRRAWFASPATHPARLSRSAQVPSSAMPVSVGRAVASTCCEQGKSSVSSNVSSAAETMMVIGAPGSRGIGGFLSPRYERCRTPCRPTLDGCAVVCEIQCAHNTETSMPFVRRRGSQLVLAHGEREPGSGKVRQRILFTLYSRPEALEAIGRGSPEGRHQFRALVEDAFPKLRFDWKGIERAIAANLDALPETYEYRTTRLLSRFRSDLCALAKQLIVADPNSLLSAGQTIDAHRAELGFLVELIGARLRTPAPKPAKYNEDNPWFWRTAFRGREVPGDIEELAAGHYEQHEFDKAEVIFRLLVDAFDDYAEGYNYLGLIAYQRSRLPEAIDHFRKTIEVGRDRKSTRLN